MRKIFALLMTVLMVSSAFAQDKKMNTTLNRAADHLMIQLTTNTWKGAADSVNSRIKGFNRSANVYFMIDKPFKGNPKMSVAFGVGIGTSNIYFDKMRVDIGSSRSTLPFIRTDTGSSYKKYKLATAYGEIPLELRFSSNPETPNKSFKAAIGVKVGTLLNAHTKARFLQNVAGAKLNSTTIKESSKSYFNTTKLAVTARAGYGIFSIFGAYNITNVFKDGVAKDTKLMQIGITISGL